MRYGRRLVVVDTPGFYDTERTNDEIVKDIIKIFAFLSPGFHALLFILNPGRFTKECLTIQNLFLKRFGPDAAKYTIIVLTHADDLERNGKTLRQYLVEGSKDFLSFLSACNNRIIAINNYAQGNTANRQVEKLIQMIDDIYMECKSCFTNNHLRLVKTFLKLERKMKRKKLEKARVALYSKAVFVLGITEANVWNYRDNKPERIVVRAQVHIPPLINPRVLPPVGSKASKKIQVVPFKDRTRNKCTDVSRKDVSSKVNSESIHVKSKSDGQADTGQSQNESHQHPISVSGDSASANVDKTAISPVKSVINDASLVSETQLIDLEEPCEESDEYQDVDDMLNDISDDGDGNVEDRQKLKGNGFFDVLLQFFKDFFN